MCGITSSIKYTYIRLAQNNLRHNLSVMPDHNTMESKRDSMGHLGTHLVSVGLKGAKWTHFEWPYLGVAKLVLNRSHFEWPSLSSTPNGLKWSHSEWLHTAKAKKYSLSWSQSVSFWVAAIKLLPHGLKWTHSRWSSVGSTPESLWVSSWCSCTCIFWFQNI